MVMSNDTLNEREFELINIIGAQLGSNQRDLSRKLDLSLGLTNMILKRLVSKGYIRITQLNKRKVRYILTSKGFAEKMRKAVKYTIKTVSSIGLIKDKIKEVMIDLVEKGEKSFIVLGKSDFALLIEIVLKEIGFNDYSVTYIDEMPSGRLSGTLLICKELTAGDDKYLHEKVNLIHELAKDHDFVSNNRGE